MEWVIGWNGMGMGWNDCVYNDNVEWEILNLFYHMIMLQVLDNSRSDWWLVSADSESQGWVPANYLEQRVIVGPASPLPDPFEDVSGELAGILMK
jgi:hypothetical protein